MNTRFGMVWELQIKGKNVKQAVRACLWAPGPVPDQGGFEPLCVSSLPARKPGICELGRLLGKTVNSNRNGEFLRLRVAKYLMHT
jgi:hypothetical protein